MFIYFIELTYLQSILISEFSIAYTKIKNRIENPWNLQTMTQWVCSNNSNINDSPQKCLLNTLILNNHFLVHLLPAMDLSVLTTPPNLLPTSVSALNHPQPSPYAQDVSNNISTRINSHRSPLHASYNLVTPKFNLFHIH